MTHIKSVARSSEQFTWRSGVWLCMQNTRLGNTFIKKKEKKRGKLRVSFADFDPKISLVITFYTHDQTFQA